MALLAARDAPATPRAPRADSMDLDCPPAAAARDSGGLDEAPFIVSSPLIPIRQTRRGQNHPNRNYRVIGTHAAPSDAQRQSSDHTEAVATPPTPVSALGSTVSSASSAASRASRTSDPALGLGAREPAMDPIVLSAAHSSSRRPSRSAAPPHHHHGADPDGRAVPVSSLLPRKGDPARAAEGGLTAQQYLVQRAMSRAFAEHEPHHHADAAASATPQIRISSPRMRMNGLPFTQSLDTLKDHHHRPADKGAADGDAGPHLAGSAEMAGSSSSRHSRRIEREREAARRSWARTSDDGDADDDADDDDDDSDARGDGAGARPALRPTQRRAVRASVATARFYVRPVSVLDSPPPASALDSPLLAGSPSFAEDPSQASAPARNAQSDPAYDRRHFSRRAAQPLHARFPESTHSGDAAQPAQPAAAAAAAAATAPTLEHRATSFDFSHMRPAGPRYAGPRLRSSNDGLGTSSLRFAPAPRGALARGDAAPGRADDGYDGDSEGLVGAGKRIPVHRRNTVAGDKAGTLGGPGPQSAQTLQMPRNTGDFGDLHHHHHHHHHHSRDDRRTMRGSRRRSTAQSLLPIGTQISPGHANYVLMYNMLTGIRVSVSRCEAKDSRPVRADDYEALHKYSFDVVGDEMTPSSRYDFKFKDYAPWVFRCIREAFHLSTEDYLVSLTDKYILSEVGSSGKSGSFFYYSQDYRFIIKTVHHTEHKFMRRILPQYYQFVCDNPHTLLSRIYGLHRIKLPQGRKVHFIVMSNILPPNKDIHAQFDLKGSMQGRELSAELASRPRACMKDRNWVNMRQRLHLGPAKRRAFVRQLINDVTLLIRLNIMDYSLLVGIHDLAKGNAAKLRDTTLAMFDPQTTDIQQLNRLTRAHTIRKKVVHTDPVALDALPHGTLPPLPESMFPELRHSIFYREDGGILSTDKDDCPAQLIYYLGVIDILTPYNAVKRAEHVVKSVVHDSTQISAVNPRRYGLRFLRFTIRSLDGCEDVLPLLDEFERTTYQDLCRQHSVFSGR
ncbi:Phosphatidylinositol-4-phosphate 5-kinase [Coemansia javaensis]|uniref:Phosphatidylinositol-4-phosphate 5-kinase n=1 Tax=Coemansia javaensis TaxID=2761396 RepID=A0A9W8LJH6_9FUNG|nr:Phosphatidylinositol-4-phosphate 5-kinase [Coemansia javaensis]